MPSGRTDPGSSTSQQTQPFIFFFLTRSILAGLEERISKCLWKVYMHKWLALKKNKKNKRGA